MKDQVKIGIIAGRKATDALLCESLQKNFQHVQIIQHQIPLKMWPSWIWKRIYNMGVTTLFGHLLLSLYLRTERQIEKMKGKNIWREHSDKIPSWQNLDAKKSFSFSEKKLINSVKNNDLIIITDSIRLSHKFFRKIKKPCLQIIWGKLPDCLGDSAAFWSFANEDKKETYVSVTKRNSQFNSLEIIHEEKVRLSTQEDIRTIKVKQAIAIAKVLPKIATNFLRKNIEKKDTKKEKITCKVYQAPTLFTYLSFLKNKKICNLPKYSYKNQICYIRK